MVGAVVLVKSIPGCCTKPFAMYCTLSQFTLPMSSHFCLQTSLPFRRCFPLGTDEQGMRMKTWRSSRLCSSSCAPAIQYLHSGDARVSFQEGSSVVSHVGKTDPVSMSNRKISSGRLHASGRSRGRRSCVSRKSENSERKHV